MEKEEEIKIQPQKVEKLEADPYLLEKTLQAQESAMERQRILFLKHRREAANRKHNLIKRRRKAERQNRRRSK